MHRQITGRLVIATHNPGKLAEMRELLAPHGIEAVSAGELDLDEPEETDAGGAFSRGSHRSSGRVAGLILGPGDKMRKGIRRMSVEGQPFRSTHP